MAHYTIDLTISFTGQEAAAWALIKPKLVAHAKKINRLYRLAGPNEKLLIRQHCPIFDALRKLSEDES